MILDKRRTDPWVVWAGTTIRTPAGREVTVTGDFPGWVGRTVTTDALAVDCCVATFKIAVKQ